MDTDTRESAAWGRELGRQLGIPNARFVINAADYTGSKGKLPVTRELTSDGPEERGEELREDGIRILKCTVGELPVTANGQLSGGRIDRIVVQEIVADPNSTQVPFFNPYRRYTYAFDMGEEGKITAARFVEYAAFGSGWMEACDAMRRDSMLPTRAQTAWQRFGTELETCCRQALQTANESVSSSFTAVGLEVAPGGKTPIIGHEVPLN